MRNEMRYKALTELAIKVVEGKGEATFSSANGLNIREAHYVYMAEERVMNAKNRAYKSLIDMRDKEEADLESFEIEEATFYKK